jgi:hypothetical protein
MINPAHYYRMLPLVWWPQIARSAFDGIDKVPGSGFPFEMYSSEVFGLGYTSVIHALVEDPDEGTLMRQAEVYHHTDAEAVEIYSRAKARATLMKLQKQYPRHRIRVSWNFLR